MQMAHQKINTRKKMKKVVAEHSYSFYVWCVYVLKTKWVKFFTTWMLEMFFFSSFTRGVYIHFWEMWIYIALKPLIMPFNQIRFFPKCKSTLPCHEEIFGSSTFEKKILHPIKMLFFFSFSMRTLLFPTYTIYQ